MQTVLNIIIAFLAAMLVILEIWAARNQIINEIRKLNLNKHTKQNDPESNH